MTNAFSVPSQRCEAEVTNPEASILILTKNEAKNCGAALQQVFRQRSAPSFEVVVVDSGSTDETLSIVSEFPVRLYQIPAHSFHHSATRNLAAGLARGRVLIFLAGDAVPADEHWLEALLEPFSDPQVGAAYGRQLPKAGSTRERAIVFDTIYGDRRVVKEASRRSELGYRYYLFSTVNAAIRADIWQRAGGFPEDLKVFEDLAIGKKILDGGWKIVYTPDATVFHSHNHSARDLFKRYFDLGVVFKRLGIWNDETSHSMFVDGISVLRRGLRFPEGGANGNGARAAGSAWQTVAQSGVKYAALMMGRHEQLIPRVLKRRMSAFHLYD